MTALLAATCLRFFLQIDLLARLPLQRLNQTIGGVCDAVDYRRESLPFP